VYDLEMKRKRRERDGRWVFMDEEEMPKDEEYGTPPSTLHYL
jgi:hypothetical protein